MQASSSSLPPIHHHLILSTNSLHVATPVLSMYDDLDIYVRDNFNLPRSSNGPIDLLQISYTPAIRSMWKSLVVMSSLERATMGSYT